VTTGVVAGDRIELVACSDPCTRLLPGERGTVEFVDDLGTVFVQWGTRARRSGWSRVPVSASGGRRRERRRPARRPRREAKRLRAEADRLIKAAAILDPDHRHRQKQAAKAREALAEKRAAEKASGNGGKSPRPTVLPLGTAGRTSHPGDPDDSALRESLVHTTEEPLTGAARQR
jgi:uncharacterized protein DUF4314